MKYLFAGTMLLLWMVATVGLAISCVGIFVLMFFEDQWFNLPNQFLDILNK